MNRWTARAFTANCSTRFSDGEVGFGAEIGIPVRTNFMPGANGFAGTYFPYKYVIEGDGQMKDPSRVPRKGRA